MLQCIQYIRRPYSFLDACAAKFGDTFRIQLGRMPGPLLILSDIEQLREIWSRPESEFAWTPLARNVFRFLHESSLIVTDPPQHLTQKREFIERLQTVSSLSLQHNIDAIVLDILNEHSSSSVDLFAVMDEIVARTVTHFAFGVETGQSQNSQSFTILTKVRKSLQLTEYLYGLGLLKSPMITRWGFKQASNFARKCYDDRLWSPNSVFGILHESENDPEAIVLNGVEVLAFLFGTLQSSAKHAAYCLMRYDQSRHSLADEVAGNGSSSTCLLKFVREVWRLNPDVPLTSRTAVCDTEIGDLQIPAGTQISLAIYLTHRNPRYFDQPLEFILGRGLEGQNAARSFVPGGRGDRRCPGIPLAAKVLAMIFYSLLKHYQIRPAGPIVGPVTLVSGGQTMRVGKLRVNIVRNNHTAETLN